MAELKLSEFAEYCGVKDSYITTYKNRGNIFVTKTKVGNRYINIFDTDNEVNKIFISGCKNSIPNKKTEEEYSTSSDDESGSSGLYSLDQQKKQLEVDKLTVDIELKNIEKQKKLGQMIPTDLIRVLFMRHNKNIVTSFKEHMTKVLNVKVRAIGGNKADVIDIENSIELAINESIVNTLEVTKSQLDNIIEDSAEKRGIGQRH